MSTEKTNKSFKKRLKTTKNGKVKSRKGGGNHFNAKESGDKKYERRGTKHDPDIKKQDIEKNLPHN